MYGTRSLYGPRLVRKFSFNEPETRRSATRDTSHRQIVAQLRVALANGAFTGSFMSVAAAPDPNSLVAGDFNGYVYYLRFVAPLRPVT